tara:strand:- start:336 stop:479 length:144 start_codon:yes stop_codon:yes gene_type:complete
MTNGNKNSPSLEPLASAERLLRPLDHAVDRAMAFLGCPLETVNGSAI